jgi:hypothetical protein
MILHKKDINVFAINNNYQIFHSRSPFKYRRWGGSKSLKSVDFALRFVFLIKFIFLIIITIFNVKSTAVKNFELNF